MAKQLAVRDVLSLVFDAINPEGATMTLPEVQTILERQKELDQLMLDIHSSIEMSPINEFLRSCLNVKIIEKFKSMRPTKPSHGRAKGARR